MKLIVGLGNPGLKYKKTRHNIGFIIIDNYLGNIKWQKKYNSLIYEQEIENEKVLFLKPQTFMNLSGNAVLQVINYYHIDIKNVLVIHDDKDISVGNFKTKNSSGSGGHNGIQSIINCVNCKDFCQLKVGIGSENEIDTVNLVLGKLSKQELAVLSNNQKEFNEIINSFIKKPL